MSRMALMSGLCRSGRRASGGASSLSLRHVADEPRELLGPRPHRPVARRKVDPRDVPELRDPGEERPLGMLPGVGLILLGGVAGADDRARDVAPGVVAELDAAAQDAG